METTVIFYQYGDTKLNPTSNRTAPCVQVVDIVKKIKTQSVLKVKSEYHTNNNHNNHHRKIK